MKTCPHPLPLLVRVNFLIRLNSMRNFRIRVRVRDLLHCKIFMGVATKSSCYSRVRHQRSPQSAMADAIPDSNHPNENALSRNGSTIQLDELIHVGSFFTERKAEFTQTFLYCYKQLPKMNLFM